MLRVSRFLTAAAPPRQLDEAGPERACSPGPADATQDHRNAVGGLMTIEATFTRLADANRSVYRPIAVLASSQAALATVDDGDETRPCSWMESRCDARSSLAARRQAALGGMLSRHGADVRDPERVPVLRIARGPEEIRTGPVDSRAGPSASRRHGRWLCGPSRQALARGVCPCRDRDSCGLD